MLLCISLITPANADFDFRSIPDVCESWISWYNSSSRTGIPPPAGVPEEFQFAWNNYCFRYAATNGRIGRGGFVTKGPCAGMPLSVADKDATGICGDKEVAQSYVQPILNVFYFIIGFLAVIMIVYGGIKYTSSAGDPTKTSSAKNTILYAVIGLIVALAAFAITSFVYSRMTE